MSCWLHFDPTAYHRERQPFYNLDEKVWILGHAGFLHNKITVNGKKKIEIERTIRQYIDDSKVRRTVKN